MSIESLTRVVSPPAQAADAGSAEQWDQCERQLGLTLPSDYRQLVQTYGTGRWMNFLWVLSPFASNTYINLLDQATRQLDAERTIRAQFPDEMPFPLYPEPEGLFPWAATDNGDRLYWHTRGEPDLWPTIVYESRGPEFDRHLLPCTEFLTRWISGKLMVRVFPSSFDFGRPDSFVSMTNIAVRRT